MMCGHHYYKMLINRSNTDEQRQKFIELVQLFGDNGESQIDKQIV